MIADNTLFRPTSRTTCDRGLQKKLGRGAWRRFVVPALALAALLTAPGTSLADNVEAADCSAAGIQSAIDECIASGGGTVSIPECADDNTWTEGDYINVTTDVPLRIIGAGMDSTIIGYRDGTTRTGNPGGPAAAGMFFDGSGLVELAGFTFRGSDSSPLGTAIQLYTGTAENLRVHHLRIHKWASNGIYLCDNPTSALVVDHNEIGDQYGVGDDHTCSNDNGYCLYGIRVHGSNDEADFEWPPHFGIDNPHAVFIEDNIFDDNYHSVSGFSVSNIVFRHNSVTNATSHVDAHGPGFDIGCRRSTDPETGTYIFEAYDNYFRRDGTGPCVNIRGGAGIFTDNTLEGCDPYAPRGPITAEFETDSFRDRTNCTEGAGCSFSAVDGETTEDCYQSPNCMFSWGNTAVNLERWTDDHVLSVHDHETGCAPLMDIHERAPEPGDCVGSYSKYTYPHPLVTGDSPPDGDADSDGDGDAGEVADASIDAGESTDADMDADGASDATVAPDGGVPSTTGCDCLVGGSDSSRVFSTTQRLLIDVLL